MMPKGSLMTGKKQHFFSVYTLVVALLNIDEVLRSVIINPQRVLQLYELKKWIHFFCIIEETILLGSKTTSYHCLQVKIISLHLAILDIRIILPPLGRIVQRYL